MSLDLEFAEIAVSGAAVGLAAAHQVWCAARTRPWPLASDAWREAAARRRRIANRWTAAALVLNLALSGAATLDWADDSIQGTQTAPYPPLFWPLVLFAVGAGVSITVNAVHAGPGPSRRRAGSGADRTPGSLPQVPAASRSELPDPAPGPGPAPGAGPEPGPSWLPVADPCPGGHQEQHGHQGRHHAA